MNSRLNTGFIFGFLLLTLELLAQERFFKNELLIGGGLHTRGYNITAEYLMFKTDKKAFCFHMEFSEIKSPKQSRTFFGDVKTLLPRFDLQIGSWRV
jgi:hypothetical protein